MSRRSAAICGSFVLSSLAAIALCGSALAQPGDFDKVVIKVHKVAGNVYMLEGMGGNIAVSVGDDGIVLVDDQFAPLADKIRAALKTIAGDKKIRAVLNTHWHGDHVGGNEKLGGEATIIAHDNVRVRMMAGAPSVTIAGNTRPPTPPAPKLALPVITFADRIAVHLNGETIRAMHMPPGHTDGDSVILFEGSNVVHMGDDFVRYGFPFIDLRSGGSVRGFVANLKKIIPNIPAGAKIIPGHGDVATIDDVKKFAATMEEIVAKVEGEIKKGKTADQLKKDKVLDKWSKEWGQAFLKTDDFIDLLYAELSKPAEKVQAPVPM